MTALALALHILGAVVWVGGMFAIYVCLRPALGTLEPPQRLRLMRITFQKFFPWVWIAILLLLASGYWMFFTTFGGFAGAALHLHLMQLIGWLMIALFVWLFHGPVSSVHAHNRIAVERSSFRAVQGHRAERLRAAARPYSPGTKAGNVVYVSGTLALDSNGSLVGKGDVKAQTRHILETINAVLEAAGGSLKDVTFNQIFLSDMGGYAAMNEVYREYFRENPPARYCIRADLVRPEFLVEIASIAHLER